MNALNRVPRQQFITAEIAEAEYADERSAARS
jgi:protein-L-isoaspartate O-methyltransferase